MSLLDLKELGPGALARAIHSLHLLRGASSEAERPQSPRPSAGFGGLGKRLGVWCMDKQ